MISTRQLIARPRFVIPKGSWETVEIGEAELREMLGGRPGAIHEAHMEGAMVVLTVRPAMRVVERRRAKRRKRG